MVIFLFNIYIFVSIKHLLGSVFELSYISKKPSFKEVQCFLWNISDIGEIPENIKFCKNLQVLDISSNPLITP